MNKEDAGHRDVFLTPRQYLEDRERGIETSRGRLLIASCRSGAALAQNVVARYEELLTQVGSERSVSYLGEIDFQFSDGETSVRLDADVNGHDVFLFQALHDPHAARNVEQNCLAFRALPFLKVRSLADPLCRVRVSGTLPGSEMRSPNTSAAGYAHGAYQTFSAL